MPLALAVKDSKGHAGASPGPGQPELHWYLEPNLSEAQESADSSDNRTSDPLQGDSEGSPVYHEDHWHQGDEARIDRRVVERRDC